MEFSWQQTQTDAKIKTTTSNSRNRSSSKKKKMPISNRIRWNQIILFKRNECIGWKRHTPFFICAQVKLDGEIYICKKKTLSKRSITNISVWVRAPVRNWYTRTTVEKILTYHFTFFSYLNSSCIYISWFSVTALSNSSLSLSSFHAAANQRNDRQREYVHVMERDILIHKQRYHTMNVLRIGFVCEHMMR